MESSVFILAGIIYLVALGAYVWFLWAFAGLCDDIKEILKELKKENGVDTIQEGKEFSLSKQEETPPPGTTPSIGNTVLIISVVIVILIIIVAAFN